MELRNFYFYTLPKVSKFFNTSADTTSPQTTLDNNQQSCGMGISIYPCFKSIFHSNNTFKSAFYGISIWPQRKKPIFQKLGVWPPPSVVFLNCCGMLFYNGLRVFKLKYGHHENVVSLLSNYKFHENSCLVSFAKIII